MAGWRNTDEYLLRPARVYEGINLVNGKNYVGVTIQPGKMREYQHATIGGTSWLAAAIRKYGRDKIIFRTIKECDTLLEAFALEARLVAAVCNKKKFCRTAAGMRFEWMV